ncbi:MAG TPA: hypothetical protein VM165_12020 [Planctomycetaceae bacterium]|nr:hypothetical protein [Planctomycetaceae bacterium]
MKAVKGIYEKGKIKLAENPADLGPVEVLVVFPESVDDPWETILNEETPRPAFLQFVEECQADIKKGMAEPLDSERL